MSYNTKNYMNQGGDELHIGGKIVLDAGGQVEGWPTCTPATTETLGTIKVGTGLSITEQGVLSVNATPDAGPDTKGLVKQGVAVADAAGANPTASEFKALLDSLRAAGVIATAEVEEDDENPDTDGNE